MIELLFPAILGEMAVILILLFKTPLRKLVIMALDRLKRGTGPLVVKTVAGVIFVFMSITVYSVTEIQSRPIDSLNPTDQIILARHMLEASLMGFLLFLLLMIDRLHHYIRELRLLRKTMEAAKKQNRANEDGKSEELKVLGEEVSRLKTHIKQLETKHEIKEKEVKSAEANVLALKSQSEGFLVEYDRLLEENQNLRNQLQSIDQSLSHSDTKKNISSVVLSLRACHARSERTATSRPSSFSPFHLQKPFAVLVGNALVQPIITGSWKDYGFLVLVSLLQIVPQN
ncbi:hypothetical protein HYC85_012065 [Camellia sinensis]|uniref:Endoplasmic reticulum transmembrane protein n=1 Tax=Camellia sinensis TaxID=4442 RepID=A0A7J7HAV6_CAMSI|nr:hypothetical protein HYC85_012065 [Camellia sinensis]